MSKPRIATVWLDGCSGCHMSLLDIDERIIELSKSIELVYSPLVDAKEFPKNVDVTFVEGAVGNEENRHLIELIRERTKTLVALGDCAVTGNVVAMRNRFTVTDVLERAFGDTAPCIEELSNTTDSVPALLPTAVPVHEIVEVDVFVPGCPPQADLIYSVIQELCAGRIPNVGASVKFG
ncbi:MAG TPA: hypothetical protein VGK02_10450 [Candidatus Aquicultor sp.]|jgi:NAD-reducing hydrogenase small subunit